MKVHLLDLAQGLKYPKAEKIGSFSISVILIRDGTLVLW